MRIYIADDQGITRAFLAEALREDGHIVEEFDSGEALLERYRQRKCDAVVTDRRMYQLSGDDVCRAIKRGSSKTRTILATVLLPTDPVADADFTVEKNGSFSKFIETVRSCLGSTFVPS